LTLWSICDQGKPGLASGNLTSVYLTKPLSKRLVNVSETQLLMWKCAAKQLNGILLAPLDIEVY
jgi:hypothetical protein